MATLLTYTITGMAAAAGYAEDSPALNTRLVEDKVMSIGLGEQVTVRLTSGQTVRGRITAIDAGSFALSPHKGNPDRVIPYSGVAGVRSKRRRLPWILVGAVAGTVALMVINMGPPSHVHRR